MGRFDSHGGIFFPVMYNYFYFLFLKVRVDSGIQQGSDISIYYDPMISKVSWLLFLNILKVWSTDFIHSSFKREREYIKGFVNQYFKGAITCLKEI